MILDDVRDGRSLRPDPEARPVLPGWCPGAGPGADALGEDADIVRLFDAAASRRPDRVAIRDGHARLTYAEVRARSVALAARIAATPGAGPVGILVRDRLFAAAVLACLRAGRPAVPLDPRAPDARHRAVTQEAGLSLVVGEAGGPALPVPTLLLDAPGPHPAAVPHRTVGRGPAFILYTSGSTGRPKGICNGQGAILHRVRHYAETCGIDRDDRFLLAVPCTTIAGIRETFAALLAGATLVLAAPARDGLSGTLAAMAEHAVTRVYLVPTLLRSLLAADEAGEAFAALRTLRLGGEPVWASDVALAREIVGPDCRILVAYSATEVPTVLQFMVPPDWSATGGRMPIGLPQPGAQLRLVDEAGAPVAPGAVGELVVRSPHLALGLWQEGGLRDGPFVRPRDGGPAVYMTGDLMRVGDDGLYVPVGRSDRQVKLRGNRVDPGEVEAALRGLPGVAEAAVIVRRADGEPVGLEAFAVPRRQAVLDARTLREALADRLPPYMRPAQVHVIGRMPLLPGLKPDHGALSRIAEEATAAAEAARADRAGPGEAGLVAALWARELGAASVEADRGWSEAGGDSLKALCLVLALEKALGLAVPFDLLTARTRPSDLAAAVARLGSPAVLGAPSPARPLVVLAPGDGGDDPALAGFRNAFAGIDVLVLRYPDARAMIAAGTSFEAIARDAAAQVRPAAQAGRTVHLAGYSFGGFVAWRLAELLEAEGVRVGHLALVDSYRRARRAASDAATVGSGLNAALRTLYEGCLRAAPAAMLEPLPALVEAFSSRSRRKRLLRLRNLEIRLRRRALAGFEPRPSARTATLFRSSDFPDARAAEWCRLAPGIAFVPVGGDHYSILEEPLRAVLVDRIAAAVARADAVT